MRTGYLLDALLLELLGGLDTLVGGSNLSVSSGICMYSGAYLDQDSLLVDTERLVKVNELVSLGDCSSYLVSTDPFGVAIYIPLSKENLASTSVETRPGMILRSS